MLSCQITHRYSGNAYKSVMTYPDVYETRISYSKLIIYKVVFMDEYGHPNSLRKFTNTKPPPRLFPQEYNYWDYVHAFENVLFHKNSQSQHSWFI